VVAEQLAVEPRRERGFEPGSQVSIEPRRQLGALEQRVGRRRIGVRERDHRGRGEAAIQQHDAVDRVVRDPHGVR
jgi:hypothetical protein